MSNDHETRQTPPPAMGYVPVGYPQQPPFPPPPQQGYGPPYGAYPNYYNGAAGPPPPPPPGTVYYASPQLPTNSPETSKGYAFARLALIIMILLMVSTITFSLFSWVLFGSGVPDLKVESFDVQYFDADNKNSTALKARWETNMTVENTNQKSRTTFSHIQGYLVYGDRLVDYAAIGPLHLEGKAKGRLGVNFSLPDPEGYLPEASVVNAMVEGRKTGNMEFYLRLDMRVTYVSGSFWSREIVMRVICGGLRVNFAGPTGVGTWNGTNGECLTYY